MKTRKSPKSDASEKMEDLREDDGSILEKVIPDGIKRGLETLLRDGRIKNVVDLKLPKEIVNHIMSQVDETKHAALGVVSKEVRLFLERTNLSDELAKLLTQVSFEITTNVRFKPNEPEEDCEEKDEDDDARPASLETEEDEE